MQHHHHQQQQPNQEIIFCIRFRQLPRGCSSLSGGLRRKNQKWKTFLVAWAAVIHPSSKTQTWHFITTYDDGEKQFSFIFAKTKICSRQNVAKRWRASKRRNGLPHSTHGMLLFFSHRHRRHPQHLSRNCELWRHQFILVFVVLDATGSDPAHTSDVIALTTSGKTFVHN